MSHDITRAEINAGGRELVRAATNEVRALAAKTDGIVRKRLLVLTHVLELTERELAADPWLEIDGSALANALRAGDYDDDLAAQPIRLRDQVRRELTVAHPGYDGSAEPFSPSR